MAVAFVSSNNSGAGDNKTVSAPASIVNGNILVLVAFYFVDGGSPPATNTCTPPTGFSSAAGRGGKFTITFTDTAGPVLQHRISCEVFTKVAASESGSYTVTISDSGFTELAILQYSGCDTTNPVQSGATSNAGGPSTSSYTNTWNGLTVNANGSMLLAILACYGQSGTAPAGFTARITNLDSVQDISELASNAGASGNFTGTVAADAISQNATNSILLALQPPAVSDVIICPSYRMARDANLRM